jgi:hypothetical protein
MSSCTMGARIRRGMTSCRSNGCQIERRGNFFAIILGSQIQEGPMDRKLRSIVLSKETLRLLQSAVAPKGPTEYPSCGATCGPVSQCPCG